jgi:hypothetical protein
VGLNDEFLVCQSTAGGPQASRNSFVYHPKQKLFSIEPSPVKFVGKRVLTTSARKPPLRTDKFAALWRIAAPGASDPKIKLRRIWLLQTHSSPKRPHEQQRSGSTGLNGVVKTAKAQPLPQNAPILTEVFGPM